MTMGHIKVKHGSRYLVRCNIPGCGACEYIKATYYTDNLTKTVTDLENYVIGRRKGTIVDWIIQLFKKIKEILI